MAETFAKNLHQGQLNGDGVLALFSKINILAHRMIFTRNSVPVINIVLESEGHFDYLFPEGFPSYTTLRTLYYYRSHKGERMLTLGIVISEPATADQRPTVDIVFGFMDISRMWLLQKRI